MDTPQNMDTHNRVLSFLYQGTMHGTVSATQRSVANNLWNEDPSIIRTFHVVPRVSIIERFHGELKIHLHSRIDVIQHACTCMYM